MKLKIGSNDDLSLKLLNVHNVVIRLQSIFNKNYNHYY